MNTFENLANHRTADHDLRTSVPATLAIAGAVALPDELAEWFWGRVAKSQGCWQWLGTRTDDGYGIWRSAKRHIGERLSHRISWVLANGAIPDGMLICHHCDNPPCCRPDHLFVGTAGDNNRDCLAKGRKINLATPASFKAGHDNPRSKLTSEQVVEIRRMYSTGMYQREIGAHFGVHQSIVGKIVRGENWKNVAGPIARHHWRSDSPNRSLVS